MAFVFDGGQYAESSFPYGVGAMNMGVGFGDSIFDCGPDIFGGPNRYNWKPISDKAMANLEVNVTPVSM